jgi:hypothetical protein
LFRAEDDRPPRLLAKESGAHLAGGLRTISEKTDKH